MWSVITIDYMNREEERQEREEEREPEPVEVINQREVDLPGSEPLQTLVARMRAPSPPAIDLLLEQFRPPEGLRAFTNLIREYLPDMEQEIMVEEGIPNRMVRFAEIFGERFFPLYEDWLADDEGNGYANITDSCPAVAEAFSSEDYDEIPQSGDPVMIVLAYVLENPMSSEDRGSFAEAALKYIPEKLLKLIPDEGFPIKGLEEELKDTKFAPVAFWASVITQDTGNFFFDAGPMEDTGAQFDVVWNRPTVDELTLRYRAFEAWQEQWDEFCGWFGSDLVKNTFDLIKILIERSQLNGRVESKKIEADFPEYNYLQGRLIDVKPDGT